MHKKLILTLLVRDEEDCIASNIEFHLAQGVDFIIATDNLSVDKTTEILKKYERQGKLRYLYEATDDYSQHRWVTRMARMAHDDYDADWVINSDADEFWWPNKHKTLKHYFEQIPDKIDAITAQRSDFIPVQKEKKSSFIDTMTIRQRNSFNAEGKPLPGKMCHRAYRDICVAQGNHSAKRDQAELTLSNTDDILIFHFPLRTYTQFKNKIIKGGNAYANNTELPKSLGNAWRYLYQQYQKGLLKEEYEKQVIAIQDIKEQLRTGALIQDERLKDFMAIAVGPT